VRILILSQYYAPEVGASQARLSAIARTLKGLGHQVEVLTGMPNYPTGRVQDEYRHRVLLREHIDGVKVIRVWLYPAKGTGFRRLANYASFMLTSLVGAALVRKPDLILVESPPPSLMLSAVALTNVWGAACAMYVADLWPDSAVDAGLLTEGRFLKAVRRLESWSYAHADFVVASANGAIEALERDKGVPTTKLMFLPNGADPDARPAEGDREAFRKKLGISEQTCVILYAGTIGVVHGVDVAVRAMNELERNHPRLLLLIVGDGSELEHVRQMASDLRVENVRFLAAVDPRELVGYWAAADIGLSCQRDLRIAEIVRAAKVLTMMGASKPIVFSGAGEGARLVAEAECALVVSPEDPRALAEALVTLTEDADLRSRLGANGRKYIEDHLSWGPLIETWVAELQRRMESSVSRRRT